MPIVQVKYQLTLDPFLNLNQLQFQKTDFIPHFINGTDNLPQGWIYVDDSLDINLLVSAGPGNWTIAVWVIRYNEVTGATIGGWKPCVDNGQPAFTGDEWNNELNNSFLINWA